MTSATWAASAADGLPVRQNLDQVVVVTTPTDSVRNRSESPRTITLRSGYTYNFLDFDIEAQRLVDPIELQVLREEGKLADVNFREELFRSLGGMQPEELEAFQAKRYDLLKTAANILTRTRWVIGPGIVANNTIKQVVHNLDRGKTALDEIVEERNFDEGTRRQRNRTRQREAEIEVINSVMQQLDRQIIHAAPILANSNETGVSVSIPIVKLSARAGIVGAGGTAALGFSIGRNHALNKTVFEFFGQGSVAGAAIDIGVGVSANIAIYFAQTAEDGTIMGQGLLSRSYRSLIQQSGEPIFMPVRGTSLGAGVPLFVIPFAGVGASTALYGDRVTMAMSIGAGIGLLPGSGGQSTSHRQYIVRQVGLNPLPAFSRLTARFTQDALGSSESSRRNNRVSDIEGYDITVQPIRETIIATEQAIGEVETAHLGEVNPVQCTQEFIPSPGASSTFPNF